MDKLERAAYSKKLIKLFRKQGHSANEARQMAGEAVRVLSQGQEWQDKAKRKADKLQNYMGKCVVESFNGVEVTTLPPKNTRRTYKNNGCRIASKAKTVSNALFMSVAQGKGKSKEVYKGQTDDYALTKRICANNVKQVWHLRALQMVNAKRYYKRQLIKAMLYGLRTTPEAGATVWQVMAHVSIDYDKDLHNGVEARNAAYNAALVCAVPYNHAAFMALNSPVKD